MPEQTIVAQLPSASLNLRKEFLIMDSVAPGDCTVGGGTFRTSNSAVAATDVVAAQHDSGGTIGAYTIAPNTPAAGSFKISVRNNSASSLSEAVVIRFAVIKAVAS